MIKLRGDMDGKRAIILVLDDEDIRRIKAGQPIVQNNASAGYPDLNLVVSYTDDTAKTLQEFEAAGLGDERTGRN